VDTLVIEAVPALSHRAFREARPILLAVISHNIVLAGDVENLLLAKTVKTWSIVVELLGFREVRKVAGVNDKVGLAPSALIFCTAD